MAIEVHFDAWGILTTWGKAQIGIFGFTIEKANVAMEKESIYDTSR